MSKLLISSILGFSMAATSLSAQITLNPISSIRNGDPVEIFDESAAEIVAYDSITERMYVVNGATHAIDIFDISDPEDPELFASVDLSAYGNPNSVAVNPRWWRREVAVAVGSGEADVRGKVVLMTKDGVIRNSYEVGYLPDMLTFDKFGRRIIVANEGEPSDDYTFDPEGSVSILNVNGPYKYRAYEVSLAGITEEDLNGARITGPEGTTIAQDLEPEYIALSPDSRRAFVVCQENNAIVVVNLARRRVIDVFGLGAKNHADLGNALDASDRDDMIRIANWPIKGLYMPDSITSYGYKKDVFILTANEGDGREYEFENEEGEDEISYIDESRLKDLEDDFGITLDESAFPLGDELLEDENLGRLTVLTTEGDIDGDGELEELYAFGARSFSIFTDDGELVYDSGDFIETYIAENFPDDFNSNNDENGSFESRSDNKGPEPEALTIGSLSGKTYAFVGLERFGGIMVFDITSPYDVGFVDFFNNRDFSVDFIGEDEEGDDIILPIVEDAGDLGPEGIVFIPPSKSPGGVPLILVANEVSGTTTIYEILED
ncbi:MAG: choice-of-anchor I family protein [Verrucomicrobiota bacterium]